MTYMIVTAFLPWAKHGVAVPNELLFVKISQFTLVFEIKQFNLNNDTINKANEKKCKIFLKS